MSDDAKQHRLLALEQAELILIMVEGLCEVRRPPGMSAAQVLDQCNFDAATRRDLKATASRIVEYLTQAMVAAGMEATNLGSIASGEKPQ